MMSRAGATGDEAVVKSGRICPVQSPAHRGGQVSKALRWQLWCFTKAFQVDAAE